MGCRNRELSEEESSVSDSLSDALLITTILIIGLPVDVHIRDGSIYSGIFHTACVENDYGIVLKKARMTRKGYCEANVANGGLIETLVILSEDLVQVVAKGVSLPADGVAGNEAGEVVGTIAGDVHSVERADREAKMRKHSKSNVDRKHISRTRTAAQVENGVDLGFTRATVRHSGNSSHIGNGKSDSEQIVKDGEAFSGFSVPADERQVEDGRSQGKLDDCRKKSEFQKEESSHEVEASNSSLDACLIQSNVVGELHAKKTSQQLPNGSRCDASAAIVAKPGDRCQVSHTSENTPSSHAISSGASGAVTSIVDVSTPESRLRSSTPPTTVVLPNSSGSNVTAKEFKLNPGAKLFCPSSTNHRSATPPAVPTVATVPYVSDNIPVGPITAAQPEVEITPFAPRSSLPVKFVPYGNLIAGHGGVDSQYPQPIVGHVGGRTQPVRYSGQYHSVQPVPAFMHPNPQNVMVGRLGGQLVYVHPVSHDVTQGAAALSQVASRPLLTPHQVHLPKHQGNAAAQALQLCVAPPFVAGGQQPFIMPSHTPITQTPFPVIRPISVPGSNGFFGTKFP